MAARALALATLLVLGVTQATGAADRAAAGGPSLDLPAVADLRAAYSGPPDSWPRPWLLPGARFTEFALVPPAAKPDMAGAALIELGRRLFDDPALSRSGQIACATCHAPELNFADRLRTSFGHDRTPGRRNTPSLVTSGWLHTLFWDGRAATLEEQALHPITEVTEMAADLAGVERRVAADPAYRASFAALGRDAGRRTDIAVALAAFERSLRPRGSLYARFLAGDHASLNDEQLRGLHLFRTKAGCANCHSGPLLSDQRFHNLGLGFYGREREDLGRWAVTGQAADVAAFRTPSLLNIGRSPPYMHNGIIPELRHVVAFYAGGGGRDRRATALTDPAAPPPMPDPLLQRRNLSASERAALVAFLKAL